MPESVSKIGEKRNMGGLAQVMQRKMRLYAEFG